MDTDLISLPYRYAPAAFASRVPVLFASPHSGSYYPEPWAQNARLNAKDLRRSEDMFVDALFSRVPQNGAGFYQATISRAYVDLNRSRDELDADLIKGVRVQSRNLRVQSGLGVIPRVVGPKLDIHSHKISRQEAENRLRAVWDPYHEGLQAQLEALPEAPFKVLVDCHSMPQAALEMCRIPKIDINLGTLSGRSCAPWVVSAMEEALVRQGFNVGRNLPYAGAYVMSAYGRPSEGVHAIQIEVARRLYMDEETLSKSDAFVPFRHRLTEAMYQFLNICVARCGSS